MHHLGQYHETDNDIVALVRPIFWIQEPWARALRERFATESSSLSDDNVVVFVDAAKIRELDRTMHQELPGPAIAICDGPLQTAVEWLTDYPWLSHVLSATILAPISEPGMFEHAIEAIASGARVQSLDWVRSDLTGRRSRLWRASQCAERMQRMNGFFVEQGVTEPIVESLGKIAEHLLGNAFYQAPLDAGVVAATISRSLDVAVPEETACELIYGCTDTLAMIRVRDPFGALSRTRFIGGGRTWQLFADASLIAVSVANQHHTDVMIGIDRTGVQPRPFACHLFFKDSPKRRFWKSDESSAEHVTFVTGEEA